MTKRNIAVITGSRADYGLLYCLMQAIATDHLLNLQLIVTGTHLSPEFGLTVKVIEQDGFAVDARVEMLLSSDTASGVGKSLGLGVIGFATVLEQLKPDIMVVLGDRFEILAAVQAALIAKVPVAHIAGGDITEGAYDDAIRHSITKMSHLHFTTHARAAQRVRQLGEDPANIFNVGSPGLDMIDRTRRLDKDELEAALNFKLRSKNLLITFHAPTLDATDAATQLQELLTALDALGPDIGLIFTKGNADTDGRHLHQLVEAYVEEKPHAIQFTSLGCSNYYSAVACMDAVVGNSSSGIYEAPALGTPTVNIGDRQKGRPQAGSVINCGAQADVIVNAIQSAFNADCTNITNPYGDGHSTERIIAILKRPFDFQTLVKKHFFDLGIDCDQSTGPE